MPKSLVLGNGNIMVCLDEYGEVRDFYFPHVGLENHLVGSESFVHRVGVWVDNVLHWLDDDTWEIHVNSEPETLASIISAVHRNLGIKLWFNDIVYNEKNIFLRHVTVRNTGNRKHEIRIFFHHQFEIGESHRRDTAYYEPIHNTLIHYKGRRVFLISTLMDGKGFDDYSMGNFGVEGHEGTHLDAEDGVLEKRAVEHGKVDSVISVHCEIDPQHEKALFYWVVAAKSIEEADGLNTYILKKSPHHLLQTTQDYWRAWVNKQNFSFYGLDADVIGLFKQSLLIIRAHTDNHGAIIASGDSDMLQGGKDTYGYVWPRDGAFSAMALDKAGNSNVARRFFEFCNNVISEDGYFMHKYRPDGSLGSSWHPWIKNGKVELPIQEDETALVIYAIWEHYKLSRDLEFIENLYNSLIKNAAEFMASFVDQKTGLPNPSYDLWEEKFGVHTFTCGTVYGALTAASACAKLLGKERSEKEYAHIAEKIKQGTLKYLWNEKQSMFCKSAWMENGKMIHDDTIDISSIFGVVRFGILDADDERVKRAVETAEKALICKTTIGGVARYVNDNYYRSTPDVPGNPWFITTLWLAQYYIALAKSVDDLEIAKHWIRWVMKYALPSGILSEQLHPYSGEQISAAPLAWSHSQYVITIVQYMEKLEEFGVCKACNPIK